MLTTKLLQYWKEISILILLGVIWFMKLNPVTKTVVENYTHIIHTKEVVEVEKKVSEIKWKNKDRIIVKEKPTGERITITEKESSGATKETNEQLKKTTESTKVEQKVAVTSPAIQKYGIGATYNFKSPLPYGVVVTYQPDPDIPVSLIVGGAFNEKPLQNHSFSLGVMVKF
jgi:hypothetical protein